MGHEVVGGSTRRARPGVEQPPGVLGRRQRIRGGHGVEVDGQRCDMSKGEDELPLGRGKPGKAEDVDGPPGGRVARAESGRELSWTNGSGLGLLGQAMGPPKELRLPRGSRMAGGLVTLEPGVKEGRGLLLVAPVERGQPGRRALAGGGEARLGATRAAHRRGPPEEPGDLVVERVVFVEVVERTVEEAGEAVPFEELRGDVEGFFGGGSDEVREGEEGDVHHDAQPFGQTLVEPTLHVAVGGYDAERLEGIVAGFEGGSEGVEQGVQARP